MLAWFTDLITSIITFILGLFGIDYKKKTVSFANESDEKDEKASEPNSSASSQEISTEESK